MNIIIRLGETAMPERKLYAWASCGGVQGNADSWCGCGRGRENSRSGVGVLECVWPTHVLYCSPQIWQWPWLTVQWLIFWEEAGCKWRGCGARSGWRSHSSSVGRRQGEWVCNEGEQEQMFKGNCERWSYSSRPLLACWGHVQNMDIHSSGGGTYYTVGCVVKLM